MKIKIAEKIILDRKHQHIIAALNQKIEKLETEKNSKDNTMNHNKVK